MSSWITRSGSDRVRKDGKSDSSRPRAAIFASTSEWVESGMRHRVNFLCVGESERVDMPSQPWQRQITQTFGKLKGVQELSKPLAFFIAVREVGHRPLRARRGSAGNQSVRCSLFTRRSKDQGKSLPKRYGRLVLFETRREVEQRNSEDEEDDHHRPARALPR